MRLFYKILHKPVLFILLMLLMAAILIAAVSYLNLFTGNLCRKGISVNNTDISEMTRSKAEKALEKHFKYLFTEKQIMFCYQDKNWPLDLNSIGLRFDIQGALDEAFSIGRTGGMVRRFRETYNVRSKGLNLKCNFDYDIDAFRTKFLSIRKEVDIKEQNARMFYKDGKFKIIDGNPGLSLDIDKCEALLNKMIANESIDKIDLPVEIVQPIIRASNLYKINAIIGETQTYFNESDSDRTHNIDLAAKTISGLPIMPGQIFSMDIALGPRKPENGYKEAPVILKDEIVKSSGGGICQVSSTLYISVLHAGLQIVERKPHSFPLNYVPPGQDATIAENYIDFKFRNNKDYPIAIQAEVKGNCLSIMVLGKKQSFHEVKTMLKSEIIEEREPGEAEYILDETLSEDIVLVSKERRGIRVIVWREAYNSGKLVSREKVSDDFYRPLPAKYKISTKYYALNKNKIKVTPKM